MATQPNYPIVNAGDLYVSNLQLSWLSNTTLSIGAGQTRDSNNVADLILSAPATINGRQTGLNGVDVGVMQVNSQYAVYLIGCSRSVSTSPNQLAGQTAPLNPLPVGGLLSLASNPVPYLPFGYDSYRRIGWASTNAANNFLLFNQYGSGLTRSYYFSAGQDVFDAAAVAATNVPMSVNVGTGTPAVPPIATEVFVQLIYVASNATNKVTLWPFGFASGSDIFSFSVGAVTTSRVNMTIPVGLNGSVPTLVVQTGTGDLINVTVVGFTDYL